MYVYVHKEKAERQKANRKSKNRIVCIPNKNKIPN